MRSWCLGQHGGITANERALGDIDLHLFGEGRHERVYERLGAHVRRMDGKDGVQFAVWAPNAMAVRVIGDFNAWNGARHAMRSCGDSGIWELFIPEARAGMIYKYEIETRDGRKLQRADPYAFQTEVPPRTGSIAHSSSYRFGDQEWLARRQAQPPFNRPMSIYEVHLGSWRRVPGDQNRPLTYRELAEQLPAYIEELGFTHVELMPIMEHPFGGSWGYQVTGYFAPTARFGTPDDFKFLIDRLHRRGIGVLLDWVPAHFPKDDFALGRFDGTALYEHLDPRRGEHPDWGTYVFNYGRNEVRNFLLANARFWLSEYHVDGLRLDAVASMLYLDYSRREGQWSPNEFGGREDLQAISMLRELNTQAHRDHPGVAMVAEESTAWPGVSRPVEHGGLGFGFKWNMGWMHDTLSYFSKDPIYRKFHHNELTFSFLYAWNENFILPLSHDEVVHGKRSLLDKMPGDEWQRFANLRALLAYMWGHPGKKLLFMGGEFGQWREWNVNESLDWHLLERAPHQGLQRLVKDLNRLYKDEPALWENDLEPSGFQWIDADNGAENVLAFVRYGQSSRRRVAVVANFSPVPRDWHRLGLPSAGTYREIFNSDAQIYGGTNRGNLGSIQAEPKPWNGQPYSAQVVLPPLSVIYFEGPGF